MAVARGCKNLKWKLRDLGRKSKVGLYPAVRDEPDPGIKEGQDGKEICDPCDIIPVPCIKCELVIGIKCPP